MTTKTTAQTIDIAKHNYNIDLTATLTPVTTDHGIVYLVTLDTAAAKWYGIPDLAGKVIGGITRGKNGWDVVAYADRDEFINDLRSWHYYVEVDGRSRAHAARMLAQVWWFKQRVELGYDETFRLTNRDLRRA